VLLKQSIAHGVGRIGSALVSFVAIAIFTRLLDPSAYGIYALVSASAMAAFSALHLWLCVTAVRLFTSTPDRGQLYAAVLATYLAITLIAGLACTMTAWLVGDRGVALLILFGFALFAATGWLELNLHILTARLEAVRCAWLNLLRSIVALLAGALLAASGVGAIGPLAGATLGALLPGMLLWRDWRGVRMRSIDRVTLMRALRFGGPLAGGLIVQGLAQRADRILIAALASPAILGRYAAAFDLADRVVRSLLQPVGIAGLPLAARAFDRGGAKAASHQLSINLVLLTAIGMPLVTALVLLSQSFADIVLGSDFRRGAGLILALAAIAAALGTLRANVVDHVFHLTSETRALAGILAIIAVAGISLTVALVPILGALGAALAVLAAQALGLGMATIRGRRLVTIPVLGGDVLRIVFATAGMAAPLLLLPTDAGIGLVGAHVVGAGGIYAALAYVLDVGGIRRMLSFRSPRAPS